MEMSPLALPPPDRRPGRALPLPLAWGADELHRLYEHAGGAAAGVVDPALVRLQYLHEKAHHGTRRVELAALPALGQGELLQEILVDSAQHVRGARIGSAHPNVAHQVDHLSQAALVQGGTCVVLGKHVLERRVVPLDGGHRVVHGPAYGGLLRLRLQPGPTGLRRHPEDALGAVLVRVFGVRAVDDLLLQLGVGLLEGIGDVLQEDQTENDMLVLGGVHAAPQGVGHQPILGLVARGRAVGPGSSAVVPRPCHPLLPPAVRPESVKSNVTTWTSLSA